MMLRSEVFVLAVVLFCLLTPVCAISAETDKIEMRPGSLPAAQNTAYGALWLGIRDGLRPWLAERVKAEMVISVMPDDEEKPKSFTVEIRKVAKRETFTLPVAISGELAKAVAKALTEIKEAFQSITETDK